MPLMRSVNWGSKPKSSPRVAGSAPGPRTWRAPHYDRLWQHAGGLDMPLDLQAATSEYIGWLQLEANRSPNTVRAYDSELHKLMSFLAANGHSLALADLKHDDLS